MKHAIWLVNSRAGSGYPAQGIKMPSRDFRGILKMSLFHCSYFIKQLPNGFPSRIAWFMHLGCCSTFGKRKNTPRLRLVNFYPFSKLSWYPSYTDHAILHGKPFGIPLFFYMPFCHMILLVIPLSPLVTLVTLQYMIPDQTPPKPHERHVFCEWPHKVIDY